MRFGSTGKKTCTLCDRPSNEECAMMPLCKVESGKKVKVACVDGERRLCARMAALGIYRGVEMELLCSGCVRVSGGTFSLGKDIADKIFVIASV